MNASPGQAREIFIAAAKLVPDQWDAYLNAACGDDETLRNRVQNLLVAHREAGSFLEPAITRLLDSADDVVSELPGTIIGPYKLLQQIGEGGMGVVYMAEQTKPVQRKVALKIIKPGMDSRQVIARFEAERQALAMMDHVNIARVIDGGTISSPLSPGGRGVGGEGVGRPYFVMELINGVPITKYCDDNHLTPRERLELFVPVCQAIQHAHQKGIIHRDIKPSNVLVTLYDGKPVPKVIDFGVAKAIDQKLSEHTLFTNFGTMVGTLEYMSPEQAEMNALGVDTRSDIYSLGVLLYELLTGSTPLTRMQMKNAAYVELLRLLKDVDPPKPSTRLSESGNALASISAMRKMEPTKLTKLVRGELDWIVMKPLEKDRNRRYETASAFAEDIQRYLKYETVKACPPSTWYRLSKFTRRYKVPIIATAIVILALLISTADSLYQMFEAKKARALADERLVNETEARNMALAAVERMLTRVADETRSVPQTEEIRLKLYQDAVEFYQKILLKRANDPELRYETAVAFLRLGEMYFELGHPEKTYDLYVTAHQSLEDLHKQWPDDPRYRVELARYFNRLYWQAFLTPEAGKKNIVRSIELVQPVVDSHPANFEVRGELVRSTLADCLRHSVGSEVGGLSSFHVDQSRTINAKLDQIEQQIIKAMSYCADESCPSIRVTAYCQGLLGVNEVKRGNKVKALEHFKLAVELARKNTLKNPASGINRWELGCHLKAYGENLRAAGEMQEAKSLLGQSVKCFEMLEKDYPNSQVAKYQTTWARGPLTHLYVELGEYENVISQIDKIEADRSVVGRIEFRPDGGGYVPGKPVNHMYWSLYRDRGIAHFHLKHYDKTLADIAKAVEQKPGDMQNLSWFGPEENAKCTDESFKKGLLEMAHKAIDKTEGKNGVTFYALGKLLEAMGQFDTGIQHIIKGIDLTRKQFGEDHRETLTGMNNLAVLYAQRGMLDKAIPISEKVVEVGKTKIGPEYSGLPIWMANLGVCYRDVGRLPEAINLLTDATDRIRKNSIGYPSNHAWVLEALAEAYEQASEFTKSESLIRDQLNWERNRDGGVTLSVAGMLAMLGKNLLKQQKYKEAEPFLRECLDYRIAKEPDDWKTFNAKSMLGGSLLGQKKFAEAEPLLLEGYQGMKQREAQISTPGKQRLSEALDRLVQYYEATNQPEKARMLTKERSKPKVPVSFIF